MLIIRNNKILVHNAPKEIYNNPKEKYVAALFDDVNEITLNGNLVLLYPHQIKIAETLEEKSEKIAVRATVLNSYFKGYYWLIEAEFEDQIVFFNHALDLENHTEISLEFLLPV